MLNDFNPETCDDIALINNLLSRYSDVLTFNELKQLLRIGRTKAYSLLKSGEIPHIKLGSEYRILKVSVAKYLYNKSHTQ